MEDMLPETDNQENDFTESLVELLRDHKGQNVTKIDLRKFQIWTDYFIIATVSSNIHMEGLHKHIREFCAEKEIETFGSSRKQTDDKWRLIDLGSVIIHLMTSEAREFYELERLWSGNL